MILTRVFLRHYRRESWEACPRCGKPLKWIYDGIHWYACDITPQLVYLEVGELHAVYKRDLVECSIYDGLREDEAPVMAHIPHVYRCKEIKKIM